MTETPKFIFQAQAIKNNRKKGPDVHLTHKIQENTFEDRKLHVLEPAEQIEQLSYGQIQNHMIPKHPKPQSKQAKPSSIQAEQSKLNEKQLINLGVDGENRSSLYFDEKKQSNLGKTNDTLNSRRYTAKSKNGEKKRYDKKDLILTSTKNHFNKPEDTSFDSSTLNESSNIIMNLNQSKALPLESKKSVKYLTKSPLQYEFSFQIRKTFGVNYFKPQFKLQSNQIKISAKKISNCFGSCFEIFDQKQNKIIGYVKGNLSGTKFNVYEFTDGNPIVATIVYKTDIVCSDTYRKIDIYLKKNGGLDQNNSLDEVYRSGMNQQIIKMVTKEPYWNQQLKVFSMNFRGKGKMSSRNNVIFVEEGNKQAQALLFCKQEQDIYFLATNSQFSPLVSMGYLLSSFDFKLLCQ